VSADRSPPSRSFVQRIGLVAAISTGLALLPAAHGFAQNAARPNAPPAPNPSAVLFEANCSGCHGTPEQGGGRGPNLFDQAFQATRTDDQLLKAVLEGVHGTEMPAFRGTLSDDESWRLVTYVRSQAATIKGKPPFVANPDGKLVSSRKQSFRMEVVTAALETPWGMAFLPDGRLLVTERPGRLRIIRNGKLLPEPVTGTPRVWERQDAGLLDVAVHPDHRRNGWIYLTYVEVAPGTPLPPGDSVTPKEQRGPNLPSMTVVVRGKLDARNAWVGTQEIFRAPTSLYTTGGSHYGSRLLFDRKGHLFFTLGDRGDPENAQNLASPLGKIHRVNADGTVPRDNPFVGRPGALPSIWSYGHRNPQGLSYDPRTGLLWESEHGPSSGDEINIIEPGRNYGWGVVTMGVQPGITRRTAPGMDSPITYYTPAIAPSGIGFYSANRYPGWRNSLFVAGLAGQQLRRIEVSGRKIVDQEVVFDALGRTRTVTTGPDGLLYILLQDRTGAGTGIGLSESTPGKLIRLVPVPTHAVSRH
jgi:glucose/arabinose dehydrogenase